MLILAQFGGKHIGLQIDVVVYLQEALLFVNATRALSHFSGHLQKLTVPHLVEDVET
jgi:hypothetical protein